MQAPRHLRIGHIENCVGNFLKCHLGPFGLVHYYSLAQFFPKFLSPLIEPLQILLLDGIVKP